MLQNKITNKTIKNLISNLLDDNTTNLDRKAREVLESKLYFILDILEIPDLDFDTYNTSDTLLSKVINVLIEEVLKHEDIKVQLLRKYIQYITSSELAVNIKEEDLESFCKILSYSVPEDNFRLF